VPTAVASTAAATKTTVRLLLMKVRAKPLPVAEFGGPTYVSYLQGPRSCDMYPHR